MHDKWHEKFPLNVAMCYETFNMTMQCDSTQCRKCVLLDCNNAIELYVVAREWCDQDCIRYGNESKLCNISHDLKSQTYEQ